jgi:cytochrome b561
MMADSTSVLAGVVEEKQSSGYTREQVRLHWLVVVLVTIQLLVGIRIGTLSDEPEGQAFAGQILVLHAIVGTIIFGLMVVRLRLRRRVGAPPPPPGTPLDAGMLARINHYGYYGLLLTMPVIGWLAYITEGPEGGFFGSFHGALGLVLVLAIFAHIAGVIYHSNVRRDGLISRMSLNHPASETPDRPHEANEQQG